MKYKKIVSGVFIERPNRFIAHVNIDGKEEVVHVKNTGRCRELLVPGARVYLEKNDSAERKTAYDLVAVDKADRLINMDSQAPNKVVEEWLLKKELFPGLVFVRPEMKYGSSRFDFYVEYEEEGILKKAFIEVKGVTLERDGVVLFPDAPSERAVKHVEELMKAKEAGYEAYIILVVQMKGVKYFLPNMETQPAFAEILQKAYACGVNILSYDCLVTENMEEIRLQDPVPVYLSQEHMEMILRKQRMMSVADPLLKWFAQNKRILPWREDPTPYHVWVSEIMLQQTRVEAVKPYYKRFIETLPDIESLAEASEQLILKLWEGLGYYSRVRNMQTAAKQIVKEYNGVMPDVYEDLLKLKGIGSYTAGAIASIAYNKAVPAVDGNVLRVVSRLCMDDGEITDAKVKKRMEEELLETMSKEYPGDFNQAMMEIGAMVCIPNGAPHCEACPLKDICMAHAAHCEEEYPKKAPKKARVVEEKTVLIVQDDNKSAIRKRPSEGLLAGMYEFPVMEGYKTAEEVVKYLAESGIYPLRIQALADSKHIFSHKEWHMKGYQIRVDELEPKNPVEEVKDWLFVESKDVQAHYPMPSALAAYVSYLNIKQGKNNFES